MRILIAVVLMGIMSISSAGEDYDTYIERLVKYNNCSNTSMSGGPDCGTKPTFDPCRTSMSGGPECKPVVIDTCAVYSTKSQDLHITGAVIYDGESSKPVRYTRLHYHPKIDMFSLEELQ